MNQVKPTITMSGPTRLACRRCQAISPAPRNDHPTASDVAHAFLELTVANASLGIDIRLSDDVFGLVPAEGDALEVVRGGFGAIKADSAADGFLAFEVSETFDLAAATLRIGRRPDTPALLPLSGSVPSSPYPIDLDVGGGVTGPGQLWGEPVLFELLGAVASKDLAIERCCPETGPRADEDEVFLTFSLRITGPDNRYGDQVGGRAVRLLVDGVPREAWYVPLEGSKGTAVDLPAAFVIPVTAREVVLQLGDSTAGDPGRIPKTLPDLAS